MSIVLVTTKERNPKTGVMETLVSHGYDLYSGKSCVLSCEPISVYQAAGARYNTDMGEWVLPRLN